ncbi:hypothetical protein D3C80_931880 [compost metagenome]
MRSHTSGECQWTKLKIDLSNLTDSFSQAAGQDEAVEDMVMNIWKVCLLAAQLMLAACASSGGSSPPPPMDNGMFDGGFGIDKGGGIDGGPGMPGTGGGHYFTY